MQERYDYGYAGRQTTDTNPVGLAGFIVSLVSLVACGGLLSPVGLILSLVGCFRQPRGLAIAGVVLGLIGSGGFILGVVVLGVGLIAGAIALLFGASFIGQTVETVFDADEVREAIVAYERANGRLPESIGDLTSLDEEAGKDLWDTPYRLSIDPDDRTMTLVSLGKDQTFGTKDDITVTLSLDNTRSDADADADAGEAEPPPAPDAPASPEGDGADGG
jgi:hypothetical protein